ncbi:hypothetical protein KAU11_08405 [Candidatus Babeliales bacterium]|nr:hypothetical protein [Candidatus Babeliales bacterium]
MNQQELADAIGVTQGCASKWLRGEHLPVGLAKKALQEKFPEIYKQILQIHKERHARK